MKQLRPKVGANDVPAFIPVCPTCGGKMEFTSVCPTTRGVIYGYRCDGDGDRLSWETSTEPSSEQRKREGW